MDTIFRILKKLGGEKFLGSYGDMDRPSVMLKRMLFRSIIGD